MSGHTGKTSRASSPCEGAERVARARDLLLERDCTAGEALRLLLPDDAAAINDGRVFVGRHRIRSESERLRASDTLTVRAPRRASIIGQGSASNLVIQQREGLLAVAKPAAWSSEPDRAGAAASLRDQLARHLGRSDVHIATRLDVGVSGVVLAAIDARGRRHLAKVVGSAECHRSYVAIVAGAAPDCGRWQASVATETSAKPMTAITHFECSTRVSIDNRARLGEGIAYPALSLLVLRPETGRRHQLRIHCSRAGYPILGDRRYAGPTRFVAADGRVFPIERILLHAFATSVLLPSGARWHPTCAIPEDFTRAWVSMGGKSADLVEVKP